MLLKASGHNVALAPDGPSGVEQARRFMPEVVLCDISMPGTMDGYAVARALRSDPATKAMFLVAVTGFGQHDDRRLALEAGFDRHLSKPVVDTVLDALLAEVGEKRAQSRTRFDIKIRIPGKSLLGWPAGFYEPRRFTPVDYQPPPPYEAATPRLPLSIHSRGKPPQPEYDG